MAREPAELTISAPARSTSSHLSIATSWSRIIAAALVAGALAWWPLAAHAGDDSAADGGAGADWERLNQVLEIPQACIKDGIAVPCKDFSRKSKDHPDASSADDDDDADAGNSPDADGSSGPTANRATIDDNDGISTDGISSGWGTLDDYENETAIEGPAYPLYGPALAPSAYALRTGPSSLHAPTLSPAPHNPLRPAGAWMVPPSTYSRPAGAPMAMPAFPIH
jgi:hypothetical protein